MVGCKSFSFLRNPLSGPVLKGKKKQAFMCESMVGFTRASSRYDSHGSVWKPFGNHNTAWWMSWQRAR